MAGVLEGRRIVVTGSSEGIGRAIALCLAQEGARVVVNASGQGSGGREAAAERLEGLVATEVEVRSGKKGLLVGWGVEAAAQDRQVRQAIPAGFAVRFAGASSEVEGVRIRIAVFAFSASQQLI